MKLLLLRWISSITTKHMEWVVPILVLALLGFYAFYKHQQVDDLTQQLTVSQQAVESAERLQRSVELSRMVDGDVVGDFVVRLNERRTTNAQQQQDIIDGYLRLVQEDITPQDKLTTTQTQQNPPSTQTEENANATPNPQASPTVAQSSNDGVDRRLRYLSDGLRHTYCDAGGTEAYCTP